MMHCKLRACQLCALKLGLPNPVLSPAGDLGEHRFGSSNPDLMNRGVWEMSPEIPVFQKYPGWLQVWGRFGDHQSVTTMQTPSVQGPWQLFRGAPGTARLIKMQMSLQTIHFLITSHLTLCAASYLRSLSMKVIFRLPILLPQLPAHFYLFTHCCHHLPPCVATSSALSLLCLVTETGIVYFPELCVYSVIVVF